MSSSGSKDLFDGCSPFFISSSVLSIVNGQKNREMALQNAKKDEEFQTELKKQKELFNDHNEAEEWAFKKWLKMKQREYLRSESAKRLSSELDRQDIEMFFQAWPLVLDIQAIPIALQNRRESLTFVIGKHYSDSPQDALLLEYTSLVGEMKAILNQIHISNDCILSFKNGVNQRGGVAVANVFAMMHSLPTVMIIPSIISYKKQLAFSLGVWGEDSFIPFKRNLFEIEYDASRMLQDKEYRSSKRKEVLFSQIAIAGVLNDCYMLIETGRKPEFPQLANRIGLKDYPHLISFATNEYRSLKSPDTIRVECEGKFFLTGETVCPHKEASLISDKLDSAISEIK